MAEYALVRMYTNEECISSGDRGDCTGRSNGSGSRRVRQSTLRVSPKRIFCLAYSPLRCHISSIHLSQSEPSIFFYEASVYPRLLSIVDHQRSHPPLAALYAVYEKQDTREHQLQFTETTRGAICICSIRHDRERTVKHVELSLRRIAASHDRAGMCCCNINEFYM